jgi:hypothetical protein
MKAPKIMNKRGVAFLTTIILLGIAVIASAALFFMLLKDAFTVKRLKASTEAYYLAEAGIEEAIQILWDNSFDTSQFPKVRSMGGGTINIAAPNISKWVSDNILLITSTGTVGGITRTMKIEVKANIPPSFNYVVLSNGKILVTQGSIVNCGTSTGVHSNSPAQGGFFGTCAVDVVGILYDCYVYGNASAVGKVRERFHGHITGTKTSDAPSVSLPSFDAAFFDYYISKASASGDVYTPPSGTQRFTTNLNPVNGVIYVNGNVRLEGDLTINGCIIATGSIDVNFITDGTVIQNQFDGFPALMSRGGAIRIWDPTTLNGLVYAAGNITTVSILPAYGDININGTIMSLSQVTLADKATVNYIKQNPPGLGTNPIGWILNWQED